MLIVFVCGYLDLCYISWLYLVLGDFPKCFCGNFYRDEEDTYDNDIFIHDNDEGNME